MKALLIGGTGTISTSISHRLIEQGWDLTILNRGRSREKLPEGARLIEADISDEKAVAELLKDSYYDTVAEFIVFTPDQIERDIRLFSGHCGQYIFISTASAYQKPPASPLIRESTPLHNPYWSYSQAKIACEDRLVATYRQTGFPITIVRPSHTYADWTLPLAIHGDNGPWQTLKRIMEGRPVVIHGDGHTLWTLTHSDDFAIAFTGLMGNSHAIGESYHITSDEALTWNHIYQIIGSALGATPRLVHISTDELVAAKPDLLGPLQGDKAHCALFDNSKIKSIVPEFRCRVRFDLGARRVIETFKATPSLQRDDPEWDAFLDRLIEGRPVN